MDGSRVRMMLGLLALGGLAHGQAPGGAFVYTGGNPADENYNYLPSGASYAATLLHDGRVLVLAGASAVDYEAGKAIPLAPVSPEIFDPATGTFTPTGNMNTQRIGYNATLLADGRVLIAGGSSNGYESPLTSAEVYDPVTGTFQLTGSLPAAYTLAMSSTLLADGRVLIVGNDWVVPFQFRPMLDPSAIYDPASGTFTTVAPIPMLYPEATLLADGRVLFVGVAVDWSQNIALIFDPASGTFGFTGSPARYSIFPQDDFSGEQDLAAEVFSTTLLPNGNVLLAGGVDFNYPDELNYRPTAEIYDPSTGSFRQTGHLPVGLGLDSEPAITLPGGQVLIGGDQSPVLYDPVGGAFTALSGPSNWSTAAPLPDGTVLIEGTVPASSTRAGAWFLYVPSASAVSSASLAAPIAPESLASIFGAQLADTIAAAADPQSPPASLGGINLNVFDSTGAERPAPLLYVSPSQINFQVPAGTLPGSVHLLVRNGSKTLDVTAQVSGIAPGIFTVPGNIAAAYGTRIEPDGSQTILPPATPIILDQRPVYLSLFGTGIRGRSSLNHVSVTIGGIDSQVSYAGAQGSIPGLDQVNVLLPTALLGAGRVPAVLAVDGVAANQAWVQFNY